MRPGTLRGHPRHRCSNCAGNEDRRIYLQVYLSSLEIPDSQFEAAIDTLTPVWSGPSLDLWRLVLDGAVDGLRTLHDANLRLGIVSNSDGGVEAELAQNEICQVGPGPGVPFE
jgi:hypothetical protein